MLQRQEGFCNLCAGTTCLEYVHSQCLVAKTMQENMQCLRQPALVFGDSNTITTSSTTSYCSANTSTHTGADAGTNTSTNASDNSSANTGTNTSTHASGNSSTNTSTHAS